jgi:hypothetical protein
MRRQLRMSMAVVGLCLVATNAAALNTTLHVNGVECFPQSTNVVFSRSAFGLRNDSGTAKTVSCPINDASDDSQSGSHTFSGTRLYFKGSQPTNCFLIGASKTGSLTFSTAFVYDPNTLSMSQSGNISPPNAISAYIQCSLPTGTAIRGATLVSTIADIAGGQ